MNPFDHNPAVVVASQMVNAAVFVSEFVTVIVIA